MYRSVKVVKITNPTRSSFTVLQKTVEICQERVLDPYGSYRIIDKDRLDKSSCRRDPLYLVSTHTGVDDDVTLQLWDLYRVDFKPFEIRFYCN